MTFIVVFVMMVLCEFGIHDSWHFTEIAMTVAILFDIIGLLIG